MTTAFAPIRITCGNCTKNYGKVVKHDEVDEVRSHYAHRYEEEAQWGTPEEQAAQMAAEAWAEGAWLRHAELGIDDGFEQWERNRGVIDFQEAWQLADPTHVPFGG